jgi:lysophospholipase L1-like esterase
MSKKSKQILSKVFLVFLGLVLGLAGGEVAVRCFGLAPEVAVLLKANFQLSLDKEIVYERVPHSTEVGKRVINSIGYRSPDYPVAKPRGTKRLVVVGDSVAEGLGVFKEEDLFARRLESELRASGKSVEVLNFSVSGYNTQQEVATLRAKALKFAPDLVLLAYCLNDRNGISGRIMGRLQNNLEERTHFIESLLQSTSVRFLMNSALYRFIRFRVLAEYGNQNEVLGREYYRKSTKTVEQSFGELARLSREHGFDVLVLVFPRFQRSDPLFSVYEHTSKHTEILRLSSQQNLQALDLLPLIRDCAEASQDAAATVGSLDMFRDGVHLSALGHQCVAKAIFRYVTEKELLSYD